MDLTSEQKQILQSKSKQVVVSASAGSGKTFVLVEKLISLICQQQVPASRLLVLTFTKAAAKEMKSRLLVSMLSQKPSPYILQQIDDLSVSDISTIDSFCEKIIKRNISKLDVDEGFVILDEKTSQSLKCRAFQSAFEKFSLCGQEFDVIYFAFKKNKDKIRDCIFEMQSYFDSLANEKQTRENFLNCYGDYQAKAKEFLTALLQEKIQKAQKTLKQVDMFDNRLPEADDFAFMLSKSLSDVNFNQDFYNLCSFIDDIILPNLPRKKMEIELKQALVKARDYVKECQGITKHFKGVSNEDKTLISQGALPKALLKLYELFSGRYSALKQRRGGLDFADIERYAFQLLQDEDVKKTLQEKYDYIFIDEYQDTNRLQESILKPIAEGGCFTAVGDIKQGIYGFRNASKEIMLEDIHNFENSPNGEALYLTGNFRTDEGILSFVNDVFEKIMTVESAGIDYKQRSKLVGLQTFKQDGLPPVSVDVICNDEKKEKTYRKGIYSVKEDALVWEDKFKLEVECIEARINEVLGSQIYDAKAQTFREVKQGDIALLFRNRSPLMKECVKHLQNKGFAVEADIKGSLLEDGQIKLICALLKLVLNLKDDICLASVMASPIGGFSLQQLADLRLQNKEGSFNEILLNSENEKVVEFIDTIKTFAFDCKVFGIIKALQKIFKKCDYHSYLKSLPDGREKMAHINQLFKMIKECDCDFKISGLITILEQNTKEKPSQDGSVDAINVTTIHATKGLEYPIVILCGCGDNLNKVYNRNYIINNIYGIDAYAYDFECDRQLTPPAFIAGKLKKAKEEFEGELMVFYVALTRAQNHLYIIGSAKEKDFTFEEIEKQNNYLKLIMFALGENFTSQLFSQGEIKTNNRRFEINYNVFNQQLEKVEKIKNSKNIQKFNEKIKKYQEFLYKNKNYCKINYKNSVTGILKLEENDLFEKENNISLSKQYSTNAIEIGNAYHEALKFIDIFKINSYEAFASEFDKATSFISPDYLPLIDKNILFQNIMLINNVFANAKVQVFKEQEFLLKTSLINIGVAPIDDEVIVQGIVDFFAIGDKNVLIDFKYSSASDEEILKNRYKKQIELYAEAIEKSFKIKLNEKYLLSLKNAKLIKM